MSIQIIIKGIYISQTPTPDPGPDISIANMALNISSTLARLSWQVTSSPVPSTFSIERNDGGGWSEIESAYSMPVPFTGYKMTGINRNFYYLDNTVTPGGSYQYRIGSATSNTVTATGTTYYVKTGGSDAAAGTSDGTAWASIDKAISSAQSVGDLVLFNKGNTFTETGGTRYLDSGSGTSDNPIVWSSYGTGNKPILDVEDASGSGSSLSFRNVNYRWLHNLELTGARGAIIEFRTTSSDMSNIKLLNCDINASTLTGNQGKAAVWFEEAGAGPDGWTSTLFIDDVEIAYCNCTNSADSAFRAWACRSGCHMHNNYVQGHTDTAYTFSGGANHICEYNEAKCTSLSTCSGSKANSQHHQLQNMIYRNNLFYDFGLFGLLLEAGYNCTVEYNTLYSTSGTLTGFGLDAGSSSTYGGDLADGNVIRYNVFVGSGSTQAAFRIEEEEIESLTGKAWELSYSVDNNLIYETSGDIIKFYNPIGGNIVISTHAEFVSDWNPDHPNDINTDPLFTDAAGDDFTLQGGSPAAGWGYQT